MAAVLVAWDVAVQAVGTSMARRAVQRRQPELETRLRPRLLVGTVRPGLRLPWELVP